jgi:hypothetical protein
VIDAGSWGVGVSFVWFGLLFGSVPLDGRAVVADESWGVVVYLYGLLLLRCVQPGQVSLRC